MVGQQWHSSFIFEKNVLIDCVNQEKKSKENYKKHTLHITVYWYFLATSLSNLVNNISERIYKIKFKYRHADKKCQTCQNKYKYCDCFLE